MTDSDERERFNSGGVIPPEPPGGRTGNVRVEAEGVDSEIAFRFLVGNGANAPEGDQTSVVKDMARWWHELAEEEIQRTLPKVFEYGGRGAAMDLIDIGRDLARSQGRTVGDEEAAELGCVFYLRGKMSRIMSAVIEGRRPSDDTLFDLGVYVRMVQRIRAVGGWPLAPE